MNRVTSFLVSFLLFAGAASAAVPGKISPTLHAEIAASSGPQKVIVLLWEQEVTNPKLAEVEFEESLDAFAAEAERVTEEVLKSIPGGFEIEHRFASFSGFAGTFDAYAIGKLSEHPHVRMIIPDGPVNFHRAEGNPLMRVPAAHTRGHRGAGVTVAVIDDGIYYKHPELGGGSFPNSVVIGGYDFDYNVQDPEPAFDPEIGNFESHGTAVAGIIAGRGDSSTGATGVAPEAKIVGLRTVTLGHVLSALDWVVTNRNAFNPAIRVVNMSLGFDPLGFYTANCDNQPNALPYTQAVERLESAGIVVVASTGNENWPDRTSIPSCLSKVISAGAVYDANIGSASFPGDRPCSDSFTGADQVTCYSNSAAFLSVLAPSHDARTPKAGGGYINDFGGTSAAAPYVSGVVALMMSAKPGLPPSQYRSFLKSTGKMRTDSKSGVSTPRVDADAAIAALTNDGGNGSGSLYIVPAVARLQGSGGLFFQSDMRVMNLSSATATATVFLLSAKTNETAPVVEFTVPAKQVRAIDDTLLSLYGLQTGGGALLFASDQPLKITTNLYTTNNICPDKGGTFGQFIEGLNFSEAGKKQRIYHVINDAEFRSNIGFVNTTEQNVSITVTLRNGNGTQLSSMTVDLGAYGWQQVNRIFNVSGAPASSNAYAEVTSTQPIFSYLSVVDNKTGDAYYVAGENY